MSPQRLIMIMIAAFFFYSCTGNKTENKVATTNDQPGKHFP